MIVCADRIREKTDRRYPYGSAYSEIRARQAFRCDACRKSWERIFQIDHIVPLAIGGSNDLDNLHLLCPDCHARKTSVEPAMVKMVQKFEKHPDLRFGLCYLCGDIVSMFFVHMCTKPRFYRAPRR